ncbi:MAG TPA: heavy-metal-associated domain-containing protein [Vicinamibacterales bacterium]|nr:heavy-metal-associated domain-containing protein [Vicinamibacterales bacterium]
MFKSVTFEVIGDQRINCAACEQRVTRLLKAVEGVGQVRAHAETQLIDVLFDARLVEARIIADRLSEAGYATKVA